SSWSCSILSSASAHNRHRWSAAHQPSRRWTWLWKSLDRFSRRRPAQRTLFCRRLRRWLRRPVRMPTKAATEAATKQHERNYAKFKRLFQQLLRLAVERQPDAILCVDFSGFNRRFAHAVKQHTRARQGPFYNWNPKIIQYVSPQVWASRPGRAVAMAADFD